MPSPLPPPRLPTEILLLIIKHAVEIWPIPEIFRARLVNKEEHYIERSRFSYHSWDCWSWGYLPQPLKRQYFRKKINRHDERPCGLSQAVHNILDDTEASLRRVTSDRDVQIQLIIDAMVPAYSPHLASYLDSDLHKRRKETWDSYRKVCDYQSAQVKIMLMLDAIWRNDAVYLQMLLDEKSARLHVTWSDLGAYYPLFLAAREGTGAIMETLLLYGNWTSAWIPNFKRIFAAADAKGPLRIAIQRGNRDVINTWLDDSRISRGSATLPWTGFCIVYINMARIGDLEMIEYLDERSSRYGNDTEPLHFEAFVEAIKHSHVAVVEWLCNTADFDVDQETIEYPKGSLFTAFQDCPPAHMYRMIEMILLNGADPNRTYPAVTGTPLQAALQMNGLDKQGIVDLLLLHGADPNARTRKGVRRMRAPLLYAARRGEVDLVRKLFKHGADTRVICRRLTVTMRQGEGI
ncbi:ankyrin repeat domain-containing protein [Aspergillus mulundensis]|uniref:Uncharacterized protein n=1 Tax=Aspergillus mulundensis TaxID=1810919 RepID=A0A3D8SLF9_9EURO|nr:hypothetical protein DSM5745_03799 [Aspergillus mulundensis]RDW87157.1 hypothetical protein DSM5745_03799 [Aspergillus mulundensis]